MRNAQVLPSRFPWVNEKRHTLSVCETQRVCIDGSWSEGSRNLHEPCNPDTGAKLPMPTLEERFATTPFDKGNSGGYAPTAPGLAYLEESTFRGKAFKRLYLHPADYQRLVVDADLCTLHDDCKAHPEMARLCPGKTAIAERDVKILEAYAHIKSGEYRRDALRLAGSTAEDTNRFVEAGWLKRNAAGSVSLTPLGRTLVP